MRNSDDRRLRRIQGGAVGAAVSRTRVPLKARSGRWAPQPVLAQRLAFFRFDNSFGIIKGEQPLIRASRASKVAGAFLVLFWCAKENLAPMQKQSYPALPTREAAQKKKSQCSTWNTGPLPSPLCRCRRDAHGILNVPIPLFPVRRCRYTVVRHQADGVVDGIHKNADVLHH